MNNRNKDQEELAEFTEGERMKGLLMGEYFGNKSYLNSMFLNEEEPQSTVDRPVIEDSRYEIYREVQHELYVADAKEHVREYIEWRTGTGQEPLDPEYRFDYDHLANLFEDMRDCSQADNDVWDNIIDRLVRAHETVQQKGAHTTKNILKKDKGESIRQSNNRGGCIER